MSDRNPWTIQHWAAEVPLLTEGTLVPKTGKKREELATRRLILLNLSIYADVESGECYPSVKSLARRGMCTTRTVQRHLVELEELGLITRHERRAANGAQQTTLYTLNVSSLDGVVETRGDEAKATRPGDRKRSPRPRPGRVTGAGETVVPVEQPVPMTTTSTPRTNPFVNSPRKRPAARKRPGGEIRNETAPSRSSARADSVAQSSAAIDNDKRGRDATTTGRGRFSPETLKHYELLKRGA